MAWYVANNKLTADSYGDCVLDILDFIPNQPEVYNELQDANGCMIILIQNLIKIGYNSGCIS